VQGAARALGVTRRVTSPTFMLLRSYPEATPPVVHCDVYRLDHLQDVLDLGDEVLASDVVTFIEWGDAVAAILPGDRLEVELCIDGEDDVGRRQLRLVGHGAFATRLPEVAEACAAWTDGGR
jgi:tRNA threonylcarbamoyladenosine biosynthesis protein TsaE